MSAWVSFLAVCFMSAEISSLAGSKSSRAQGIVDDRQLVQESLVRSFAFAPASSLTPLVTTRFESVSSTKTSHDYQITPSLIF